MSAEDERNLPVDHGGRDDDASEGRQRVWQSFTPIYSRAVLAVGVLVAIVGGLAGDWNTSLERAATVVVAAAPCAYVISLAITYVAAIGDAGRRVVVVKSGGVLADLVVARAAGQQR